VLGGGGVISDVTGFVTAEKAPFVQSFLYANYFFGLSPSPFCVCVSNIVVVDPGEFVLIG
jgi:hypothetical protein